MSRVSASLTADLWDDVVRRVTRYRRVLECQGAAATGVDTAAIDERGVAGDDAIDDGECAAFAEDTAALVARRITEELAVVDGQRARKVEDGAAEPAGA